MFNSGHESGRIPAQEILGSTADGLVYREYLDSHYTTPNRAKLIEADVNEPPWDRRIPGCLLYAKPGEWLHIHVWNADTSDCHSFHIHGLHYGIESDGAWPLGVATQDGRRSDEIFRGQKWTYVYDVTPDMVGAWGFHDHAHDTARNINLGLFGGLIVRNPAAPRADHEVPIFIHQFAGGSSIAFQSKRLAHGDTFNFTFPDAKVVNYYCAIHGPTMNGTIQVVADAPASANVSIQDNKFVPPLALVRPGGTVAWHNDGDHDHIVFSAGAESPASASTDAPLSGIRPQLWGTRANGYAGIYSTWTFPASGTISTPIRFAGRFRHLPEAHPTCMESALWKPLRPRLKSLPQCGFRTLSSSSSVIRRKMPVECEFAEIFFFIATWRST
jgi:plastocyanin